MKLNDIRQGPGLSFRFTAYTVPKLGSGLPAVCACTRDGENKAQQKVSFFWGGKGGVTTGAFQVLSVLHSRSVLILLQSALETGHSLVSH